MKYKIICLVTMLAISLTSLFGCSKSASALKLVEPQFKSPNLLEGASVVHESLKKGEKADGANTLTDSKKSWTPRSIARSPADGQDDACSTMLEIKLKEQSTFNTAVIEELGNEVQYFRLQAFVDGEWQTVYQSEKIQSLRLCSFDSVETDTIRLSIDKFRSDKKPAKINSIRLYNEPLRTADDFNITVYQRFDGDVPSEVLKRSQQQIADFARYYDVYNTVLIFDAIKWENGKMVFNVEGGEEGFARELAALRQIIAQRSNQKHDVRIICTALADGAGGNGHVGVNEFMAQHWESVAKQIIAFYEKYDLDGLDIDWEYPNSKADWQCYDKFITLLDDEMQRIKPGSVLSGALSAWALGMSDETLHRFDQIQFMAYDGMDKDGYQSSLDQAQRGLTAFTKRGVKPEQINIGIAAYGRPINGAPYWKDWRSMQGDKLYWNNMHYNVDCANQVFDGTFCSPALAGDKTAYALLSGVGGVMVFRLACDKTMDDPNAVACGIENAMKRYVKDF